MIRDPIDKELPYDVGQIFVSDPYDGKKVVIEPKKIRDIYQIYAKQQEKEVEGLFRESKSDFIKLVTDKAFVGPMITFFKGRTEK